MAKKENKKERSKRVEKLGKRIAQDISDHAKWSFLQEKGWKLSGTPFGNHWTPPSTLRIDLDKAYRMEKESIVQSETLADPKINDGKIDLYDTFEKKCFHADPISPGPKVADVVKHVISNLACYKDIIVGNGKPVEKLVRLFEAFIEDQKDLPDVGINHAFIRTDITGVKVK